jgi:hypothetical protein
VSCFYQKKCTSVISDLVLSSIKSVKKKKEERKVAKKVEKGCEKRVERSVCAQVLKVLSVA